jgi:O-antigen/teichoic acid export membrane protein
VSGLVIALNVAACLLLFAGAPLVALAFHEERLIALVRVASLQFLLSGLATLPQSLVYRAMRFKWLAAVDLTSVVCAAFTTLVLAWKGAGVWALVIGSLVQNACAPHCSCGTPSCGRTSRAPACAVTCSSGAR